MDKKIPMNILAMTHDSSVSEAYDAGRKMDSFRLDKEIHNATSLLEKGMDSLKGPDGKTDLTNSIPGENLSSEGEKATWVIEAHSRLAGLNKAKQERDAVRVFSVSDMDKVESDNNKNSNPDFVAGPMAAYDAVMEQVRDTGHTELGTAIRAAGNLGLELSLSDLNGRKGHALYNAVMTRGAGWTPEQIRLPGYVPSAQNPITLWDIIPHHATQSDNIRYMKETTFTVGDTETAEGAASKEATFVLTEQVAAIEKFSQVLPVTDEQLADESQVQFYINERLPFAVRLGAEEHIWNTIQAAGASAAEQVFSGTLADPTDLMGDIKRAATKVKTVGKTRPTDIVLEPTLWSETCLEKSSTGGFLLGNPGSGFSNMLWGLPVVETHFAASAAVNNIAGFVWDRNWSAFADRTAMVLKMGYVGDDFKEGKVTMKAEFRGVAYNQRDGAIARLKMPSS